MGRQIFEDVQFHNLKMKNRLIRSATWEGLSDFDGSISDEAYDIYRELSHGGVGAVIVGFTDVSDDDYYIHGAMRLSRDELRISRRLRRLRIREGFSLGHMTGSLTETRPDFSATLTIIFLQLRRTGLYSSREQGTLTSEKNRRQPTKFLSF